MSAIDYRDAARRVAADLEGTCQSLERVLERFDLEGADNAQSFCDTLDAIVFCCTQCDWWFPQADAGADVNGQWTCEECSPLNDEDDE